MATTRSTSKSTTKKATTKTAKSTSGATKKTTAKPKAVRTPAKSTRRYVGLDAQPSNFFQFRITIQTVYWAIIGALVLALGIWIINLQMQVHRIYDAIDTSESQYSQLTEDEIRFLKERKATLEAEAAAKKTTETTPAAPAQ